MPRKIRDSVVVITGASSGIGRATALEFVRKGATVVVAARREQALARHGIDRCSCNRVRVRILAAAAPTADVRREYS